MKNQGSFVVIVILAVAVGAAVFAWNFRMQQSYRVLDLYGGQFASLIRAAETVQWLEIVEADHSADSANATGNDHAGTPAPAIPKLSPDPIDITDQPGLVNARAALISDVSYRWDAPPSVACWQFALRFKGGDRECSLAFDLDSQQCLCLENGHQAVLGEKLVSGLRSFVDEVRLHRRPKAAPAE